VVTQTRGRTDEPPKLSTPKKFHIVQHPVSHLRRVLFNHPIRSNFFYFELGTDQLVIFIVDLPRSFGSASVPIVNPSRLIQQNVTNKHSIKPTLTMITVLSVQLERSRDVPSSSSPRFEGASSTLWDEGAIMTD
jgi:hypothetical protein